jgi:hypothetical protein
MAMVTLLRLSGFYTKWQRTVRITSTDALIDGHPRGTRLPGSRLAR